MRNSLNLNLDKPIAACIGRPHWLRTDQFPPRVNLMMARARLAVA